MKGMEHDRSQPQDNRECNPYQYIVGALGDLVDCVYDCPANVHCCQFYFLTLIAFPDYTCYWNKTSKIKLGCDMAITMFNFQLDSLSHLLKWRPRFKVSM